jgi:YfiH family protein
VSAEWLRDEQLVQSGIPHGFGVRGAPAPSPLACPRQVHGAGVAEALACLREPRPAADAVVSTTPGLAVGVVTADCVPILLARCDGRAVVAVHAGWRGLACGVVGAGVEALRRATEATPIRLVAAIGPHIGPCCYEVDGAVLDALAERHRAGLERALRPSRAGHAMLDLGALARDALVAAGVARGSLGEAAARCTSCDARRFHSYRRDGPSAGRLVHFVAAAERGGPEA